MATVRKLIEEKAEAKIYTVPSNATVFEALQVMFEGNTGAVLVTEDEKIVGIEILDASAHTNLKTILPIEYQVAAGVSA